MWKGGKKASVEIKKEKNLHLRYSITGGGLTSENGKGGRENGGVTWKARRDGEIGKENLSIKRKNN